jgi:hypothetical protein
MRRVLIVLLLLVWLITACASAEAAPTEIAPTEEASDITQVPTESAVPADSNPDAAPAGPAQETVIKQLAANLGLKESDITVVSNEVVEFPDACLGITMEGVMCAQVITPGRIIVLEANGIQYEYHTSEDGDRVQPATPALLWKREGGIAGFCDTLVVFRSGEVFTSKCNTQSEGRMGTLAGLLTAPERQQFNDWTTRFGEVKLDASDPKGVADQMIVTLEFNGMGSGSPTESEQQVLFKFAQDLYQELTQKSKGENSVL